MHTKSLHLVTALTTGIPLYRRQLGDRQRWKGEVCLDLPIYGTTLRVLELARSTISLTKANQKKNRTVVYRTRKYVWVRGSEQKALKVPRKINIENDIWEYSLGN